jgi:hypothetical protein
MPKVDELDADLVAGLKQAKSKRMYFAMVVKGGADGALLVGKTKIPPKDIAEAKKKCGGSAVVKGAVFYEDGRYVFETAKEPAATLPNALKIIAKRDAGLSISPICRKGTSDDLADEDGGDGEPTPSTSQKPVTKDSGETGQKPSGQRANFQPLPETSKYETALQMWEQASAAAQSATDKLLGALAASDDDLAQAIAGIIAQMQNDFPDTLDDALTNLAKTAKAGDASSAEQFRTKSEIAIKAALAYLNNNAKTIEACEKNPFGVNVSIRAPLTEALKQVLVNVKK